MNSSMSTSSQILSEDTHLNHVKASNTIENFLKKQKSDLPIYKQEGYADLVESVQVFESCANTTTVSSLEEFDITSKIHAFDTILEVILNNLSNTILCLAWIHWFRLEKIFQKIN